MDVTPIYELRTRLRAAAVAGANLLSEDFRLKKAAESFSALRGASPVFAKISDLTAALTSESCEDKAGTLLDAITLVDSVICTLGAVEVSGDAEDITGSAGSADIVNAPYSELSAVIDALTASGSGKYEIIHDTRENRPELFSDYRVRPALVKGLGAPYAELADMTEEILLDIGGDIVPLLKKDFDPKGKKEMLRRIGLIERLRGAAENEFYLEQLEDSEKDIRRMLIYALRFDSSNAEKLMSLTKTEKGKAKDAAMFALAAIDCEETARFFEELSKKKPEDALKYMAGVSAPWACRLTAKLLNAVTADENGKRVQIGYTKEGSGKDAKTVNKLLRDSHIKRVSDPLTGKSGAEIEEFYRSAIMPEDCGYIDAALGTSIVLTNDEGLKKLALELNAKHKGQFLYAETIARFFSPDNCTGWLEKQLMPIRKKLKNSRDAFENDIVIALGEIRCKKGKYGIETNIHNEVKGAWMPFFREFTQPVMPDLVDLMIKLDSWALDEIMCRFYDRDDDDFTAKLRTHIVEDKVLVPAAHSNTRYAYYGLMYRCGFTNIRGMAVKYFTKFNDNDPTLYFVKLPGTNEYKREEARDLIRHIREGKLKCSFNVDEFETWVDKIYN